VAVAAGALAFVPATAHALDIGDVVEDTVDTTDSLVDDTLGGVEDTVDGVEDTVGGVDDTVDGLLDDPPPSGGGGDPAPEPDPPGDPVPPSDPTPQDPRPGTDPPMGSDDPRPGAAAGPQQGGTDEVGAIDPLWVAADPPEPADGTVVPAGDATDPVEQPAAAAPSQGFVSANGAFPALALVALAIGALVLLHSGVLWLRMQDGSGSSDPLAPVGDDPF
jgi:hypothetical protein